VAGLATDYCVKQSVVDALRAGLEVVVLTDAIAGIDARPGDVNRALEEMQQGGAALETTLPAPRPSDRERSPDERRG
jgi:nicotinamidase/pyrazinamidase